MMLFDKHGDELYILYKYDEKIETGDTLLVWDEREERGLLAYVIGHEYLASNKILEELVYKSPEYSRKDEALISMRIAKAKIRMEINRNIITFWTGWIPTRDARISRIPYRELIKLLGLAKPKKRVLIGYSLDDGEKIYIDGVNLQGITIITGEKGSGKSHLAKTILIDIIRNGGKAVVIDLNNEYSGLRIWKDGVRSDLFDKIVVMRPSQDGLCFTLDYIGIRVMQIILNKILGLPEHSTRVFSLIWNLIENRGENLSLDNIIKYVNNRQLIPNDSVRDAILSRLSILASMGLLTDDPERAVDIRKIISKRLKDGGALIINLRGIDYQTVLATIQIVISKLSEILERSSEALFLFIEEAQLYVRRTEWIDLVTRVRHLGLYQVYITNTPRALLPEVIDQTDNLFLYRLSDEEDVRFLTPIARMDSKSLSELSNSIPYRRFILFGKASNYYPLMAENIGLPYVMAGETKKIWE